MHTMPSGLFEFKVTDPAPTCGRWKEHMPAGRAQQPYRLYINARNFWRSKVEFEFTRAELQAILNDVSAAADQDDWGAKALLANFYLEGLGPLDTNSVLVSDPEMSVKIVKQAVAAGQAWANYDLGVAYENGYGGIVQDSKIAWAYYRKAAELGSPEAQMALADAYEKSKQPIIAKNLRLCAYNQGFGPAAKMLGMISELEENFEEALRYYQDGVRYGNSRSAYSLMIFFDIKRWDRFTPKQLSELRGLNLSPDYERSKRYEIVADALKLNPDLRLSHLDKILPLPPVELPPWTSVQDAIEPERDGPPTY